jgi:hypothetical protein
METEQLVSVQELAKHHKIEASFITSLNEFGLIEVITLGETQYIHEERIADVERMIRLHYGLDINIEGIDAISTLLQRIDLLEQELNTLKNRLRLYEGE